MIAYLEGRLLESLEHSCLVLTEGGVGYEVNLTGNALSRLPQKGGNIAFYVHTVIREDAMDLYGFETFEERSIFGTLISIPKLGPKKAVAILTTFSPEELHVIVGNEDVASLTRVSGIGKKSGQQILFELKFKLDAPAFVPQKGAPPQAAGVFADTVSGLRGLGYDESEAAPLVRAVLEAEPDLDTAGAIRAVLKTIAAAKS